MEEGKGSGPTFLMKVLILAVILGGGLFAAWKFGWLPGRPAKDTTVPVIDGAAAPVKGTTQIRLAHWTWNAHQSWALANKGKTTKPDSLFAKNGISVQFARIEEIPAQVAAFKAFAKSYDKGNAQPTEGVHFFTIMGDASGMVLNEANKAVQDVNSDFTAEIVAGTGFSAGEDKFMGPPEWKKNPKTSLGGLVAGVPADGDWNVMIFWAAQNGIPFNADTDYYDPNALNFLETDGYIQAGEVYNADKPVTRRFKNEGKDCQGNVVKKGDKGCINITGVVTWTPVDKNIADKRGGLVSIVSTKEYSNQMPCYIIGLKQWDMQNKETVKNMLKALYNASDMIIQSEMALKSGSIPRKSAYDNRWTAAQYTQELFESETPDFWYTYYNSFKTTDSKGVVVEIGGSSVSNLKRNLQYFGMDGGESAGKTVYNRFAKLAQSYYPDKIKSYPSWESAFNPTYLTLLQQDDPALANTNPNLPVFTASIPSYSASSEKVGELTYRFNFESGRASFMPGAETQLNTLLSDLVIQANTKVEIHGYTDSSGDPDKNMALSQMRGYAIYNWLHTKSGASFPANRVAVIPHGQNDLMVNDRVNGEFDEDAAAKNRRVVVKIFKQ